MDNENLTEKSKITDKKEKYHQNFINRHSQEMDFIEDIIEVEISAEKIVEDFSDVTKDLNEALPDITYLAKSMKKTNLPTLFQKFEAFVESDDTFDKASKKSEEIVLNMSNQFKRGVENLDKNIKVIIDSKVSYAVLELETKLSESMISASDDKIKVIESATDAFISTEENAKAAIKVINNEYQKLNDLIKDNNNFRFGNSMKSFFTGIGVATFILIFFSNIFSSNNSNIRGVEEAVNAGYTIDIIEQQGYYMVKTIDGYQQLSK